MHMPCRRFRSTSKTAFKSPYNLIYEPTLNLSAAQVFDEYMPQPNQLYVRREEVVVTGQDLLSMQGVTGAWLERYTPPFVCRPPAQSSAMHRA